MFVSCNEHPRHPAQKDHVNVSNQYLPNPLFTLLECDQGLPWSHSVYILSFADQIFMKFLSQVLVFKTANLCQPLAKHFYRPINLINGLRGRLISVFSVNIPTSRLGRGSIIYTESLH